MLSGLSKPTTSFLPETLRFFSSTASLLTKVSITHIAQSHKAPCKTKDVAVLAEHGRQHYSDFFPHIVKSQLDIANYLKKKNNPVVATESLEQDLTPHFFSQHWEEVLKLHCIFPQGIPECHEQLNIEQQNNLYAHGGTFILFYLGLLSKLYKTILPQDVVKVEEKLSDYLVNGEHRRTHKPTQEEDYYIHQFRNKSAVKLCLDAAKSQNQQEVEVQLVFGARHDIKQTIDELKNPLLHYGGKQHLESDPSLTIILSSTKGPSQQAQQIFAEKFKEMLTETELDRAIESCKLPLHQAVQHFREDSNALHAMRYYNFRTAFMSGHVSLSSLQKISKDQIMQIRKDYKGRDLKDKVDGLILENQKSGLRK